MIGEKLKLLRKQRGVTAKSIADALGILPDTYRSYETGRREPNLETLKAISDHFEVSADYLLGRDVPSPECLTESEKDLEECILEKYKQLPESYRKKFLQGVIEAVEIQRREQTTQQADTVSQEEPTQPTMQEQGSREEHIPTTEAIQKTIVKPAAAARQGEVPHLEDDAYWDEVDRMFPDTDPSEFNP